MATASTSMPPPPAPEPPAPNWGRADQNPENDGEAGPPPLVPNCQDRLAAAGIKFSPSPIKASSRQSNCSSEDAVRYEQGPTALRFSPPPVVSCQLALALPEFEKLVQHWALKELGAEVRKVQQGGTYNCRKMARFQLASEHSYANAIDVYSFTLTTGRRVSVERHFEKTPSPSTPEATFLQALARNAYDTDLFSVVLTPYWDKLHHNHFHLDMARYRADGTRPQ